MTITLLRLLLKLLVIGGNEEQIFKNTWEVEGAGGSQIASVLVTFYGPMWEG